MELSETFWLTTVGLAMDVIILACLILFFTMPRQVRQQFVELGIILIVVLTADIAGFVGAIIFHTNMNPVYNVLLSFQFPLVVSLYRNRTRWRHRNVVAYTLVLTFTLFALINLFFIQGFYKIDSYTWSLEAFCLIIISMTYALVHGQRLPTRPRIKRPMYWINTAILINSFASIYIHFFIDYLRDSLHSNLVDIWIVHNILGLVYYGMLCYALILIREEHKKSTIQALT